MNYIKNKKRIGLVACSFSFLFFLLFIF